MPYCVACKQFADHLPINCPELQGESTPKRSVTRTVTPVTQAVTKPSDVTPAVTDHHCPGCRCFVKKYESNAERQRAYRERKTLS